MRKCEEYINFRGVFDDETTAFDVYFASVCSMQYHPGAGTKEHKRLSVSECKDCVIEMLKERRKIFLIEERI